MQVKVRGSGKTLSIQIPDEIAEVMEIAENSVIDVTNGNDEPTLEELLDCIPPGYKGPRPWEGAFPLGKIEP